MERVYGVTAPITTALPTEREKESNEELARELRAQGNFEAPAESQKRLDILRELGKMADEFVKRAAAEKESKNTFLIRNARGRIFTYGSYRLGVYGPGSDMDTLVVAPKYVTAEQYFRLFPTILQEMAPPGAITDLNPVPDAFVPIIKFEFHDISVDLIFCAIQMLTELPSDKDWNLADNRLLRGLTESAVRSLNGTRVTDEILNLVPEPATFRLAIRAIKLWAERKAVYSNILGYPGGIAWNIMVARVCQLYPKATSAVIVRKFFTIMGQWPWPLPVLLKDIEYGLTVTQSQVWNPKINPSDRAHRMPIITPSYPSMCTTHNVCQSSMMAIQRELKEGAAISDLILEGKAPWSALFTKSPFFTTAFKFYLTVTASSKTPEDHKKWSGFVESRVRHLVGKLDLHPSIQLARPFNHGFKRVHRCKTDGQIEEIQAGSVAYQVKEEELKKEKLEAETKAKAEIKVKAEAETEVKVEAETKVKTEGENTDIVPTVKMEKTDDAATAAAVKGEDVDTEVSLADVPEHKPETPPADKMIEIYTTNHYIGLELKPGAKSLDLSKEVGDFKSRCMNSELYNRETMCLTVLNIRNWELPDDVFGPGEVKPARPKRKRPAEAGQQPNGEQQNTKRRQTATVAG